MLLLHDGCQDLFFFFLTRQTNDQTLIYQTGKKNESSQDTKHGHLKPVQTVSQTQQLTITDWAKKKSHQTATNLEEKGPVKSSHMQSSVKVKEVHQLLVEKTW